ncbi:hypothetical protein JIN77_02550 [Verrucomicrobiaceae bacterium R5-34]|nr:hypothetical protein [Verrucomicrobiaceae bacterium R5-34]
MEIQPDYQWNPHALALRLEQRSETEVETIYHDLLKSLGADIQQPALTAPKLINLSTSSSVDRGAALKRILGDCHHSVAHLLPTSCGSRNHAANGLLLRCHPHHPKPRYYSKYPGLHEREIDEAGAIQMAENPQATPGQQLIIECPIPCFTHGWEIQLLATEPPYDQSPIHPQASLLIQHVQSPPAFAEQSDLGQSENLSECLTIVESLDDADNKEQFETLDKLPDLLLSLCQESDLFFKPTKIRMISVIVLMQAAAAQALKQQQEEIRKFHEIERHLLEAENDWREMFIDQAQLASISLNARAAAHPLLKTKMIFKGEREAQIASYLKETLIPKVQVFTKRQAIKMQQWAAPSFSETLEPGGFGKLRSNIAAGLLLSLPSAALLIPTLFEMEQGLQKVFASAAPLPDFSTSIPAATVAPPPEDFWQKLLEPILDRVSSGFSLLGEQLQAGMGEIHASLNVLHQGVGSLTGAVIAGSAGAALAGILVTIASIKGSLSLSQAEELLKEKLREVEQLWPEISKNLQEQFASLNGQCSRESQERARRVMHRLQSL